jgi:hypothetical protein
MPANLQAAQDPGVARIKQLLLAARPQMLADGNAIMRAGSPEPYGPNETYIDLGLAIGTMRSHVQALRASVLAQAGASPAAASARDLAAQTLLETDQALEQLGAATNSYDSEQATRLRDESMRLLSTAAATSVRAGAALGIAWPF